MKNIMVAGSGVLGAQIAFQCAFHGCNVMVYDVAQAQIDKLGETLAGIARAVARDMHASEEELTAAIARLHGTTDLAEAVRDAELVIEAVPEDIAIKRDFYVALNKLASPATIFATNSSTLRPSEIAPATGRPERFLALHFANQIWLRNTAEIMRHPGTDLSVFEAIVAFAKDIGMVALPLHKEQPGYILNSLLVPLLENALTLAANEIADPHTIDKTWMIATGAPTGPFAILDVIGLRTAYHIGLASAANGNAAAKQTSEWLKTNFIDKNRMGVETGEGFYTYPSPDYEDARFLAR